MRICCRCAAHAMMRLRLLSLCATLWRRSLRLRGVRGGASTGEERRWWRRVGRVLLRVPRPLHPSRRCQPRSPKHSAWRRPLPPNDCVLMPRVLPLHCSLSRMVPLVVLSPLLGVLLAQRSLLRSRLSSHMLVAPPVLLLLLRVALPSGTAGVASAMLCVLRRRHAPFDRVSRPVCRG